MNTREACLEADRLDPLAPLRKEFFLPEGVIYLDGNSLGVQPKAAVARAGEVLNEEWAVGLIRSWNTAHWFDLPAYYAEVRRVTRPRGAVALVTYGLTVIEPKIDRVVSDFYTAVLGAYWSPERRHVEDRAGDVRHKKEDIGKARRLLGFETRVDFADGMRRNCEYFVARFGSDARRP